MQGGAGYAVRLWCPICDLSIRSGGRSVRASRRRTVACWWVRPSILLSACALHSRTRSMLLSLTYVGGRPTFPPVSYSRDPPLWAGLPMFTHCEFSS